RDYSRRYGNGYVDEYEGTPSRNHLQPPMMGYFTPSHPVSPRAYEHRYDRDGTACSADSAPLALLAAEEEASGMYRDRAEHGSSRKSLFARLAIEHVPRVYRNMQASIQVRNTNMRKVVQLCQREVRRVYGAAPTRTVQLNPQQPTFAPRPPKEQLMRARRSMREMLVFWKRYEKEEREMRKRAEREAAERRKQEEEAREARRQKRKLNFLLTQTELYSHFIGSKIGGGGDEDKSASETQAKGNAGGDATEFKDIDFDAEDDATLAAHARQSAQNALAQQQAQMREFDDVRRKQRSEADAKQGKDTPEDSQGANVAEAFDAMDFQEPQTLGGPEIAQPRMLMCELKEYQLKGLNWLANLYEQGINGILADEMGLGKTVQSISLLAYLAEKHNIWGPFMVVAPASTLHNWEQELKRFVPEFKVLPYWGSPKDRKVLRKSLWNPKSLSRKDSGFHVLVTSYQLVVTDEQYLNRVKWQYMVLDEAQAIKSSASTRWKTLLGFHCRNRLLLTGTPIQNSMQELWALLHFIMPTLFDSHEEFSEWFSRDIEAHAENRSLLNRHQLHRLHMILKPFMLRRNKRHVQHELGEKIEHLVPCDLTQRQKVMYRGLMSKISLTELLEHVQSGSGKGSKDDDASNLMNLVMQFRKVCSHPELFERAEVDSPYMLGAFPTTGSLAREGDNLECSYATRSLVSFQMPKLVYRESLELPQVFTTRQSILNRLSLWSPAHISKDNSATSVFSLLRLCTPSIGYACKSFTGTLAERLDGMGETNALASSRLQYRDMVADDGEAAVHEPGSILHALTNVFSPQNLSVSPNLAGLAQITQSEFAHSYMSLVLPAYKPAAVSPAADLVVCDRSATWEANNMFLHNPLSQRLSCGRESVQDWTRPFRSQGLTDIWMPSKDKLIRYSGKMAVLDKLLIRLKQEGHRVLLYFQMTKMIDLFEEYLAYRKYTYLRLDGSSKIADRRDMVMDWQTRDDIFIFLLTTRAGGLGINLTAADTVIFFESDWNPTVDSQAMDRAHRMGQKKQVVVYRLITRGTVEERILQRARQKDEIHRIVIAGGDIKAAANDAESEAYAEDLSAEAQPSSKEIMSWLLDESANAESTAESERLAMARQAQITSNRIYGAGGYPGELDVSLLSHLEGDVWSQVVLLPPPNLSAMTVHNQPASAVAVESALEAAIWEQQREIEQRRREQQRQRGRGRGGRRGGGQPREKRKARASVGAKKDDASVAGSQTNTPEPTTKRIRTNNGSGVSSAAPTPVEAEAADSVLSAAVIS
ncbi:putative DNA helicase ino80, partial [Coemansia sp. RSA 2167]